MRLGELAQGGNALQQALQRQLKRIANHHQVTIVSDIAARRSEMDDRLGFRALIGISVDVGHHVMSQFFLVGGSRFKVDVVLRRFHLGNLRFGDRQPQFFFRFRQPNPQLSPEGNPTVATPKSGHFFAGITRNERIFVQLIVRHIESSSFGVV